MPSVRFTIRLSESDSAAIALLAQKGGLSQIDLIRSFVQRGISGYEDTLNRVEARLDAIASELNLVATTSSSALGYLAFHHIPLVAGEVDETRAAIRSNIKIGLQAGRHIRRGLETGAFDKE